MVKFTRNRFHSCTSELSGACLCAALADNVRAALVSHPALVSVVFGNPAETARLASRLKGGAPTVRKLRKFWKPNRERERQIVEQADTFAKRTSMDATWRVWLLFVCGVAEIRLSTEQPTIMVRGRKRAMPEARASVKTRGKAFGLRFHEAETILRNVERKLRDTGNSRTFRVDRSRRA